MITSKTQLDEFFATHSEEIARELMQKSQTWYEKIEDFAGQEFIVPATEKQLNDAIIVDRCIQSKPAFMNL